MEDLFIVVIDSWIRSLNEMRTERHYFIDAWGYGDGVLAELGICTCKRNERT